MTHEDCKNMYICRNVQLIIIEKQTNKKCKMAFGFTVECSSVALLECISYNAYILCANIISASLNSHQ